MRTRWIRTCLSSPGIDYLLGVRDDLRQGAVRFRDPRTQSFLADEDGGVPHLVDLPLLLDLADRAERDVANEEELEILLRGGSSLGGARPKAHVLDRSGRIAIAKFPRAGRDDWDVIRGRPSPSTWLAGVESPLPTRPSTRSTGSGFSSWTVSTGRATFASDTSAR